MRSEGNWNLTLPDMSGVGKWTVFGTSCVSRPNKSGISQPKPPLSEPSYTSVILVESRNNDLVNWHDSWQFRAEICMETTPCKKIIFTGKSAGELWWKGPSWYNIHNLHIHMVVEWDHKFHQISISSWKLLPRSRFGFLQSCKIA